MASSSFTKQSGIDQTTFRKISFRIALRTCKYVPSNLPMCKILSFTLPFFVNPQEKIA